ncbi:MAG: hypothetical protein NXI22_05995 [bacterium]|nr:hypothetical protein [bacterium]
MKIDVHTHTKKCKKGDAPTREISPRGFCDTILSTEVRIVAITNHNVFDLDQYAEINTLLGNEAQVWPGIELDVVDNGSRGHLLVIASPKQANSFSEAVEGIVSDTTPDDFIVGVDEVVATFDELAPLYIAHYEQKKPNISDETIDWLITNVNNPNCVIKEVTNSISAGIYISHGHASIYGSDVHDWAKYEELSHLLPDLRLPVDSFEHFCLLLAKDPTTINTALDRKTSEELLLSPFEDDSELKIKVFNDINVVFGNKGTGKSRILKGIAQHYSGKGLEAKVYESASDKLDEIFDTKGKSLTINLNNYDISYCTDEFEALRNAREESVTSISAYVTHFSEIRTNKNSQKMRIKDIEPEETGEVKRDFESSDKSAETTSEFLSFLRDSPSVQDELPESDRDVLVRILSRLSQRLLQRKWETFSELKRRELLNSAIKLFRREIARKTGMTAKPTTTGFRQYAINRMHLELNASTIIENVRKLIPQQSTRVGSLGADKGELYCETEFRFQDGTIRDGSYTRHCPLNTFHHHSDGCELNECEEGLDGFIIACGDTA